MCEGWRPSRQWFNPHRGVPVAHGSTREAAGRALWVVALTPQDVPSGSGSLALPSGQQGAGTRGERLLFYLSFKEHS